MDAQAAPSDNPQKLGLRASRAMTSSKDEEPPAGTDPSSRGMRNLSNAPRRGSRTVSFSSGVIKSPARPTMRKAMRQLMRLGLNAPKAIPAGVPMGFLKEYALKARARSLLGK